MKRKTLREQLDEAMDLLTTAERNRDKAYAEVTRIHEYTAKSDARVKALEQLVLAYKRFALKLCIQRDLKHDAPPHSHALALKESMEAGAEVERLSRDLWPEAYARLDAVADGMTTTETGKEEDPKWN